MSVELAEAFLHHIGAETRRLSLEVGILSLYAAAAAAAGGPPPLPAAAARRTGEGGEPHLP